MFSCVIFFLKPWTVFGIIWWIESSKKKNHNIVNIFTVTFDQFNASLLDNKMYVLLQISIIEWILKEFWYLVLVND